MGERTKLQTELAKRTADQGKAQCPHWRECALRLAHSHRELGATLQRLALQLALWLKLSDPNILIL